jgi:hypothetical protein
MEAGMLASYNQVASNFATHYVPPFFQFLHWQNNVDWGSPVEAIQDLFKHFPASKISPPSHPSNDSALVDILTPQQIKGLLNMYARRSRFRSPER